ncbi:MAG: glycosyltransferase family 4 protein [Chthonomonadaceae bacterium]|nr:glycosyltransferase family 4 protein [Chthonomonadaceae bacterium]
MRIVVHDYSGHPFQVELSRALARRGHHVLHLYSGSFLTPQGALAKRDGDPDTFQVEPIKLDKKVDKSNVLKRRKSDIEHGQKVVQRISTYKPDIVLSANTPLDAQKLMLDHCHSNGVLFAFWVQDLIGQAVRRLMRGKWAGLGTLAGNHYVRLENKLLLQSDKIVVISEDFRPYLPDPVKNSQKIYVVENWAPLGDMPVRERVNDWGRATDTSDGLNFIYSGTLGMKHNPELLVQLANNLKDRSRMIVVSEGQSIEFLKKRSSELGLDNLKILPFQPFEAMPDMLATADVLTAVLEPDAGVFSVPSKVLTYLCAGKPLLVAIPKENLAARIVQGNEAGIVVDPGDIDGFVAGAKKLADDLDLRQKMGANARAYAERTFDIERITDQFESLLRR